MVYNLSQEYEESLVVFEYPSETIDIQPHYYNPEPIETKSEYMDDFGDFENYAYEFDKQTR